MSAQPSDAAFAQYASQAGLATADQLDEARQLQADARKKGQLISLADALVLQGAITAAQKDIAEKKMQAQQAGGIKSLGNYKLLKKLGEGGMGAVYLAEDTNMLRKVALKVLPRKYAGNSEFLTRFRREAKAAGKLNHENIVSAFTVGEELGNHYYVMEFCEGEPLDKLLKREGALSWEKAVEITMQVARGLQHAHQQNFIHRDIKPANIFVAAQSGSRPGKYFTGLCKILDMGLSKNIGDSDSSFNTQTGVALGTPHYISPEQAKGEKDVDGRTDIYSLGATLYHLLTGKTPFDGSTAAHIIMKHLTDQIPNPQDIRENIPDGVVLVVQKMMAKDAIDRYEDCAALLEDLEAVLEGKTPSSVDFDVGKSSVAMREVKRVAAVEAADRIRRGRTGQHQPIGSRERESSGEQRSSDRRQTDRRGETRSVPAQKNTTQKLFAGGVALAGVAVFVLALTSGKPDANPPKPPEKPPEIVKTNPPELVKEPVATTDKKNPPEPPEQIVEKVIADARRWKPIFDGKSMDGFRSPQFNSWHLEDGKLVNRDTKGALECLKDVQGDVDFRIKFDTMNASYIEVGARGGRFVAAFDRLNLPMLAGRVNDLIVSLHGSGVSGTINGSPLQFKMEIRPAAGGIVNLYQGGSGTIRVHSFEYAELVEVANGGIDDAWIASVQKMTVEKQVEAIAAKLKELNPEYDGQYTLENGGALALKSVKISNLSPLRAASQVRSIAFIGDWNLARITNIEPLAGLEVKVLRMPLLKVADLSPLKAVKGLQTINDMSVAEFWAKSPDAPAGAAVDLLSLYDVAKDSIRAGPALTNGELLTPPAAPMIIQFPYIPPEQYDIRAELTSDQMNGWVNIFLSKSGHVFRWAANTRQSGFDGLQSTPDKLGIPPGKRVSILIQVRNDKTTGFIDGVRAGEVSGPYDAANLTELPDKRLLGIATHVNPTRFHKLEVVDVSGRGSFLRPDDAAAKAAELKRSGGGADDVWAVSVQKMTPEKQVEAVVEKLRQLNKAWNGPVLESKIDAGAVTKLRISSTQLRDISPLRALKNLTELDMRPHAQGLVGHLENLEPLRGINLQSLDVRNNAITDLKPLAGMPLVNLLFSQNPLKDMSALAGMNTLRTLDCNFTLIADHSPIKDLPLKNLIGFFNAEHIPMLRNMKTLERINMIPPADFIANLEKNAPKPNDAAWISKDATYTVSSVQPNFGPKPALLTGEGGGYTGYGGVDRNWDFTFHTKGEEANGFIVIDLGKTFAIDSLQIINRKGDPQFLDRAKTLTAWSGSAANGPWDEFWRAADARPEWLAKPTRPVQTRYIKLGVREAFSLHLHTVKVFGRASDAPAVSARPAGVPADAVVFRGHAYKLFNERVTWDGAKKRCEEAGGHLVYIESSDESEFLSQQLKTVPGLWMWAGSVGTGAGKLKWANGNDVDFTNWDTAAGQPKDKTFSDNNKVVLTPGALKWHDTRRDALNGFICEWDGDAAPAVSVRPANVPADATEFQGHWYRLYQKKTTWKDAKARCEEMGGHLAYIESKEEQDYIAAQVSKTRDGVWLGATDEAKEGDWRWLNGQPLTFKAWGQLQPNGGVRENYLSIAPAGFWADTDDSENMSAGFMCEWENATPAAPRKKIDLMKLIDLQKDQVKGTWTKTDTSFLSDMAGDFAPNGGGARLQIPYQPPEEYDFKIVFTRVAGVNCAGQIFPAKAMQLACVYGGYNNTVSGFEMINGEDAHGARNSSRVLKPVWRQGQKHTALIEVRKDGAKAYFDGELLTQTPANYDGMGTPAWYGLPDSKCLGITSFASPTAFHEIEVTEISGKGVFTRPKDPAAIEADKNRGTAAVEVPSQNTLVFEDFEKFELANTSGIRLIIPASLSIVEEPGHGKVLRINYSGTGAAEVIYYLPMAKVAGRTIRYSVLAKCAKGFPPRPPNNNAGPKLLLRYSDNSPNLRYSEADITPRETDWHRISATHTLPPEAKNILLGIRVQDVTADVLFDDFRIEVDPAPDTNSKPPRTVLDFDDAADKKLIRLNLDTLDLDNPHPAMTVAGRNSISISEMPGRGKVLRMNRQGVNTSLVVALDHEKVRGHSVRVGAKVRCPAGYKPNPKADWAGPRIGVNTQWYIKLEPAETDWFDLYTAPMKVPADAKWLHVSFGVQEVTADVYFDDLFIELDPDPNSKPPLNTGNDRWANAIHLLPLVDPAQDTVSGAWTATAAGVSDKPSDISNKSKIELPYVPPEEYDLRAVVTLKEGGPAADLTIILVQGTRNFSFKFWGVDAETTLSGFENIDGKNILESSITRKLPKQQIGRTYEFLIEVRKNSLMGYVDGQLVSAWKPELGALTLWDGWRLRNQNRLGLGCSGTMVQFTAVDVVEVTGKGKMSRDRAAVDASIDDPARWAKAIDLLKIVDAQRDAVDKIWSIENGALKKKWDRGAIEIPYYPPEEYDLRIEYTKHGHWLAGSLSRNGERFWWTIDENYVGFFMVNGEGMKESNPTYTKKTSNATDSRNVVIVQVRKDSAKLFLNGQLLSTYTPNMGPLTDRKDWKVVDPKALTLSALGDHTYHRVDVLEISGKGTFPKK